MAFRKINPKNYSPAGLVRLLEKSKVLLEVNINPKDHNCSVTSYANQYDGTYMYQASHYLAEDGPMGENEVEVESEAEWTEKFLSGKTWISIWGEEYGDLCDAEDYFRYLLLRLKEHPEKVELYQSDDCDNFYGPLECEFIEWWIKKHKGYHTGVYF